ncbi:transcriptional regulator, SARP family protein, partial [Streptomyces sp. SID14478]|uniref:AfsR/SARP family transcriptional regulator n=1 Tax=Streptomyces sp. SID14478 TaxID=2706073 RepID=UPI001410E556|nr:transcriptional regulator, SARP family protein [Streptomyces sp. SID14478]
MLRQTTPAAPPTDAPPRFQLLGPVAASRDGHPLSLGSPKQRCVLAALLLTPGKTLSTEQLIQCVWGHSPPPTARSTLHSYVTRLRGALGPQGDAAASILHQAGGYLLTAPAHDVDLHRFRTLTGRARTADSGAEAERTLDEALGLWHGDPLSGIAGDWAESVRARLVQERLTATLDRVDHRLTAREPAGLAAELRDLAAEHPWDERLAAQLMTVLFRSAGQAAALAHYESFRRSLAQE